LKDEKAGLSLLGDNPAFCNGTVMLKISKLENNFTKTLTFKAFSCIIKISIKR